MSSAIKVWSILKGCKSNLCDWTQWGEGEERPQSSAGCKVGEALLIGKLGGFCQCQPAQ